MFPGRLYLDKGIRAKEGQVPGPPPQDPAELRLHWDIDDSDLAFAAGGDQGREATDTAIQMSQYHNTWERTTDTAILMSDYHSARESTTDTAILMSDFHTARESTVDVAIILSE